MTHKIIKRYVTPSGYMAAVTWVNGTHFCGYVEVPKEHPFFGKNYRDKTGISIPEDVEIGSMGIFSVFCVTEGDFDNARIDTLIDVHGGITYADTPYYLSKEEEKGTWCFGFACHLVSDTPERCDAAYAERHCNFMAKQLKAVEVLA